MNNGTRRGPRLCKHKRSGRSYAKFNGNQVWFGPWDDPATHEEFARYKAEWMASGRQVERPSREAITVADLVARFLLHSETYYRKPDGTPTHEIVNVRYTAKPLLALYGSLPAGEFGVRQLKAVRAQMVERGLARKTINDRTSRIVRMFKWASGEELIRLETWAALRAVEPLRAGRSEARETGPVAPVEWGDVEATLSAMCSPVRGLVLLQWYTGMRPGEAIQMRPMDLEREGSVWLYRPVRHKLEHHAGKRRVVALGPRAQEVLRPFLDRVPRPDPKSPIFSPRDATAERHREARRARKTPRWPSHVAAKSAQANSSKGLREPGTRYRTDSYRRAIARACDAVGVDRWTPNQLRHAAATRIRAEYGIDAARVILGHSSAETTEIYAEMDHQKALQVAQEVG